METSKIREKKENKIDKFDVQKRRAMSKFENALCKEEVDRAIISFLKAFNEKRFYYTTSSCAGRIILLYDLGSKKDSYFVARWHRKVMLEEVLNCIEKFCDEQDAEKSIKGILWFKQEPLIMHLVAYDINRAKKILSIAIKHGLKHSGIMVLNDQRYIVEINGNERMSVPIVHKRLLIKKENLPQYLSSIAEIANEHFEKNEKRRDKFLDDLKNLNF